MKRTPILHLDHVSKSFGAVEAVSDVSLEVYDHEVVALVGDNAAGKSTIARMVAGAYAPTSGQIYLGGEPVSIDSTRQAFDLGIATVFQELALCENLDVTANVFLGHELTEVGPFLRQKKMDELASEFINTLGGRIPDPHALLSELSDQKRGIRLGKVSDRTDTHRLKLRRCRAPDHEKLSDRQRPELP